MCTLACHLPLYLSLTWFDSSWEVAPPSATLVLVIGATLHLGAGAQPAPPACPLPRTPHFCRQHFYLYYHLALPPMPYYAPTRCRLPAFCRWAGHTGATHMPTSAEVQACLRFHLLAPKTAHLPPPPEVELGLCLSITFCLPPLARRVRLPPFFLRLMPAACLPPAPPALRCTAAARLLHLRAACEPACCYAAMGAPPCLPPPRCTCGGNCYGAASARRSLHATCAWYCISPCRGYLPEHGAD